MLMKVKTKGGFKMNNKGIKVLKFAATETEQGFTAEQLAGILGKICQMPEDIEALIRQTKEDHERVGKVVKKSGHHSCYSHEYITLILVGIPKAVAMVLNSLQFYNTSEKSGRYTIMKDCSDVEKAIYNKWVAKLTKVIMEKYPEKDIPKMTEEVAKKKAMENARKFLSVFTPTVMAYTTSRQQWNYIIDWCAKFRGTRVDSYFYNKLADSLEEFAEAIKPQVYVEGLRDNKEREFYFFTDTEDVAKEYIGTVYATSYLASFDEVAQCERHRVLNVLAHFDGNPVYNQKLYSVPIILNEYPELKQEWLSDYMKVADLIPQGLLLVVEEKGTFMSWRKSKSLERDCGQAQLEIMLHNKMLRQKFKENRENLTKDEQALLDAMESGVRCRYGDFKCTHPCIWGPDKAANRLI